MGSRHGGNQARIGTVLEALRKRFAEGTLKKEEEKVRKLPYRKDEKNGKEDERKKGMVKERDQLRKWELGWGNKTRIQILGDSNLVDNWMNGGRKINNQKFRAEVQRTQNFFDIRDLRPMSDHMDLCQHIYREWNENADCLTHKAREEGCSWNFFTVRESEKREAVRAFFDGGVSNPDDRNVRYKVGYGYLIQASEKIEEGEDKMRWRTIVEVAETLLEDATITQDETTAAAEAAKAICCLFQSGFIRFDIDGHLGRSHGRWTQKKT